MAEFASNGKGNLGVALGGTSLGLGLLNGAGGLLGMMGGAYDGRFGDHAINRYELDLIREILNKDTTIAIEKSENYTDKKLVEVYTALNRQDKEINAKIDMLHEAQNGINTAQAVYNGNNSATLACMRNQIDELLALTQRKVPNSSVCPGWGAVTVTPGNGTTIG